MKPQSLAASFLLFVALCASFAYWGMQLFKPPVRPVAAPQEAKPEIQRDAVAAIFGGRPPSTAVASNFTLKGIIMSGTPGESVAIIEPQGKPEKAVAVNSEIVPGVVVKEVQPRYITLSESGVTKRVELPANSGPQGVNQALTNPGGMQPMPAGIQPVQPLPRPAYPVTPAEPLASQNPGQPAYQAQAPQQVPQQPMNPMGSGMRGMSMRGSMRR